MLIVGYPDLDCCLFRVFNEIVQGKCSQICSVVMTRQPFCRVRGQFARYGQGRGQRY